MLQVHIDRWSKPRFQAQSQTATPPPVGEAPKPLGTSTAPAPEIHPGSSPRPSLWNLSWPELGGVALLAMFAYYALVESVKGARHDSPKFVDALNIWHPLVIARQPTPRAVKRWMNRVRYLATRELPASELRSPIERFADWYAARGETEDISPGAATGGGKEQPQAETIPEEIVVALAAIHEFDPEALKTPVNFKALRNPSQTVGLSTLGESADELIAAKRELHMKAENFSSWDQLATYAPRFLALWPNIDVR